MLPEALMRAPPTSALDPRARKTTCKTSGRSCRASRRPCQTSRRHMPSHSTSALQPFSPPSRKRFPWPPLWYQFPSVSQDEIPAQHFRARKFEKRNGKITKPENREEKRKTTTKSLPNPLWIRMKLSREEHLLEEPRPPELHPRSTSPRARGRAPHQDLHHLRGSQCRNQSHHQAPIQEREDEQNLAITLPQP